MKQSERPRDDGFSLIETIVAVVLMAGILTSAAGLMIRSTQTNRDLQGKQAAVAVARQVMENVRAVPATFSAGVAASPGTPALPSTSKLVAGRSRTDVMAQWAAAAAAGVDVSQTYTGAGSTTFDSHTYAPGLAASVAGPAVDPQQTVTVNNQLYTVDTLIGTCVRVRNDDGCKRLTTGDELFRVVVRVVWSPSGGRRCGTGGCSYVLTTLIDPTAQPTFNSLRKPVCVDDPGASDPVLSTPAGVQKEVVVLGNDSGDFPLKKAVELSVAPTRGTVVTDTDDTEFFYTPANGFSGTDTFRYACIDVNGTRSDTGARVTIKVLPVGILDSVSARTAVAQSVSPLANDKGSSLTLTGVGSPTPGGPTFSVSGSTVTLISNGPGTFTVPYTGKDAENQAYTGTITLTVVTPPVTAVNDTVTAVRNRTIVVPVTANDTVSDLTQLTVSAVTNGSATPQVLSATSGQVTYTASTPGTQSFDYTLTDVRGKSAIARTTVTVLGAVGDSSTGRRNTGIAVKLLGNDMLPAGASIVSSVRTSGPAGGTMSGTVGSNGVGTVSFDRDGTYTFDYTVSFTGPTGTTTDTATVRVVIS